MKPEIKKRIEQINNGIVPNGYKKTKLGIIPEDWEIEKLYKISKINKNSLSSKTEPDFEFKYYDLSNVNNGIISHPKEAITFENSPSRAKRIFTKNNILMSTVRPYLKGFAFINFEANDCIASTGFAVLESEKGVIDYIYQYLFSKKMENQMKRLTVGSNYPALNSNDVNRLKFLIPKKKKEQTKIAKILSTWDKAIELKEKLLEKKEEQKKGLMQKLLTGDKRLPGFEEEWEDKKLEDIATFHKGKNISKKDISEKGTPCILYGELYTKYGEIIKHTFSKTKLNNGNLFFGKSNDIIIPSSGETAIDISTASCLLLNNVALGGDINVIRNNENGIFLSYYFNSVLKIQIAKIAQGVSVVHLYNSQLKKIKIKLPSLSEQTRIAKILSTWENDLYLLENEIEKLKEQKRGLMQLLLTGKVRTV